MPDIGAFVTVDSALYRLMAPVAYPLSFSDTTTGKSELSPIRNRFDFKINL
jgi:hypothetical protein